VCLNAGILLVDANEQMLNLSLMLSGDFPFYLIKSVKRSGSTALCLLEVEWKGVINISEYKLSGAIGATDFNLF
jgi:hypothetical protein